MERDGQNLDRSVDEHRCFGDPNRGNLDLEHLCALDCDLDPGFVDFDRS